MALNLFFPPEIENIFFVILLLNTKAIVAGTIYRPPIQSEFFGNYKNSLTWRFFQNKKKQKTKKKQNKTKLLHWQSIVSDIKKYYQKKYYVQLLDLKQLIEAPTCVACSSSTIIDQILKLC